MPNPPRTFVPDGIYHIWSHGSDDRPLFLFDSDRVMFLAQLGAQIEAYELTCIAFCLMSNHHHLIVRTPDDRLSRALQELHGGYSRAFNRIHGRTAHLFRNRFGSRLVESDEDLLGVARYVALNPIEAAMCREPRDWPWSSYRASIGLDPAPRFLDDAAIGDALGGGRRWRERYRAYIEALPFAAV